MINFNVMSTVYGCLIAKGLEIVLIVRLNLYGAFNKFPAFFVHLKLL